MVGVVYALYCLDPTMMLNAGFVRPARAILPEGIGDERGHAGRRRHAQPDEQPRPDRRDRRLLPRLARPHAGLAGQRHEPDERQDHRRGAGAPSWRRSARSAAAPAAAPMPTAPRAAAPTCRILKNTPVEINEAEVPIAHPALRPGAGFRRRRAAIAAASALEMEFQLFAPQSMVTARNRDRSIFSAWGLRGGMPGADLALRQEPGHRSCVELGSIDIVPCDPGDIILIQGPGAGGYGNPLDRPADDVLTDVRRGLCLRSAGEIGLRRGHRRGSGY